MSTFREELRIIPRAARVTAWIFYALTVLAITAAFLFSGDADMARMPLPLKVVVAVVPPLAVFLPVYLFGYIYADAKRRYMRYVMWTLLAILVPNAIGILLYFTLRDPLPLPCGKCGSLLRPGFAFCPSCGAPLKRPCPQCQRPVEAAWSNCAYCGVRLG